MAEVTKSTGQQRWRGGPLVFEIVDDQGEALLSFETKPSPERPISIKGRFDLAGAKEVRITVANADGNSD